MNLGERIKALRTEKGLTMDMFVFDINSKFGIDLNKGLVSKWENNINEPSLKYAGYLCQYYDISLDYLIGLTDCKTPARLLAYASRQKSSEVPQLKLNHRRPVAPPDLPTQKLRSISKGTFNGDNDDFEFDFLNND